VDQIPPERLFGPGIFPHKTVLILNVLIWFPVHTVSVVDLRSRVKDNPNYQISTGDLIEWESVKGKLLERLIIMARQILLTTLFFVFQVWTMLSKSSIIHLLKIYISQKRFESKCSQMACDL